MTLSRAAVRQDSHLFVAQGPFFNFSEGERLLAAVADRRSESPSAVSLDLSRYSFLGLHEIQVLLLALRHLARRAGTSISLRLPDLNSTTKFLERWDFFEELVQHPQEYFLYSDSVTIGDPVNLGKLAAAMAKYDRPSEYLSKKVHEIKRVEQFDQAINYVRNMHRNRIKSILISNMRRECVQVEQFADVICLELLKNIIHHVLSFRRREHTQLQRARVGFIAMQTHDAELVTRAIGRYGMDMFLRRWPPFLEPFIRSAEAFVELSVVDEGAGLRDTIEPYFRKLYGRSLSSELEALQFACREGVSRYHAMSEEELRDELNHIRRKITDVSANASSRAISEYVLNLRKEKPEKRQFGYGLFLVAEKVREWNGIIILRSGNTCYCPYIQSSHSPYAREDLSWFPGVQVRVLLPMGTYKNYEIRSR